MRSLLGLFLGILILSSPHASARAAGPRDSSVELEFGSEKGSSYKGSIGGKYRFVMYLRRDGTKLWGWYAYEVDGTPIELDGAESADGTITIGEHSARALDYTEENEHRAELKRMLEEEAPGEKLPPGLARIGQDGADADAVFRLRAVGGQVEGSWLKRAAKKAMEVRIAPLPVSDYSGIFRSKKDDETGIDGETDRGHWPDQGLELVPIGEKFWLIQGDAASWKERTCGLRWTKFVRRGGELVFEERSADEGERYFKIELAPRGRIEVLDHSDQWCGHGISFRGLYANEREFE